MFKRNIRFIKVAPNGDKTKYWSKQAKVVKKLSGKDSWRALKITNNYYQRKKKSSIHTLWAKSAQLLFRVKFISRNRPLINWGDVVDWHFMPPLVYIM